MVPLIAVSLAGTADVGLPRSLDLVVVRGIPVQHDGRWPPLDTLARDIVESVTGEAFYRGRDPVLWLLAWTFEPRTWMREPLIEIGSAELRAELQLAESQTVFSYAELASHQYLQRLIDDPSRTTGGGKLDPLEAKVRDIDKKLGLLERVLQGDAIRVIPDRDDALGTWRSIAAAAHETTDEADSIQGAWAKLTKAFLADDAPAFASASEQLAGALAALPAGHRPEPQLIATELRYNKLRPFRLAWLIMAAGAGLAAAAMLVRRRWFDGLAVLALLAGFGMLTCGLSLRWQIAGRIPAANMFESLLFLSWGMGGFAIVMMLVVRDRVIPLTASGMGAMALILADNLPLDHYIRPIVPVLMDTVWMSIHVPVVMASYAVLAVAALVAHVQLVVMATVPRRGQVRDAIDSLHYWYVLAGAFLLGAGIITGSMWAASSWGRYWGWDPKEVWSLIAFLAYLAILHLRIDRRRVPAWAYGMAAALAVALFAVVVPKLAPLTGLKLLALAGTVAAMLLFVLARGQFATALKSVVAFWLIIMTYVGVNYVLGIGLHSYGFGTGAVVRYMFLIGGIDLLLIALCSAVYVARLRAHPPQPSPLNAPVRTGDEGAL